ncbi:hypothetical protein B0H17DRAFT_915026 [Mycena rosella]|uniref:Uncharacterized protein n=1 Tax=Mycena rosella TaxID=1033263 RepID=A0AAD7MCB8_MYCRO|nr:hypothetical protein B0H17DRAFT_915026 [Mycena rosella]
MVTSIRDVPSILVVSVSFAKLVIDEFIGFKTPTREKSLRLTGLIYHSEMARHFTSMVLDKKGYLWYHDGITTRSRCTLVGHWSTLDKLGLHRRGDYKLSAAIYADSNV